MLEICKVCGNEHNHNWFDCILETKRHSLWACEDCGAVIAKEVE